MKKYKVKLLNRIERTPTVLSFRFVCEEKINFIPGQFLQIIFDEKDLANIHLNKYLSLSSSPLKPYLEVTKRLSESEFSQRLKSLEEGEQITIRAPLGNCVFYDEYKRIGFLIGGIGITPVISIIEYIVDKKLSTQAILLYSNRSEEEIAFRTQLDEWTSQNERIKVYYTLTHCLPGSSRYFFGFIDKILFNKLVDIKERIFYIFGPPYMVKNLKEVCLESGCSEENIKIENFLGYEG